MRRSNRDFDAEWEWHGKVFKLMFAGIVSFIGLTFLYIIGMGILYATVAVKTFNYVDEHGLKTVIERVWEGDSNE